MPATLVVIGFDAANAALVSRLVDEGKLPTVAGLRKRGVSGTIAGVEGFYVGSTWPSFSTGLNPAGHGFYRLVQLRNGTYEFFKPLEDANALGGVPFWRIASDAGKRVALLDVPLAPPEPQINGAFVSAWGAHNTVFGLQTTPPDLAGHIVGLIGDYPAPSNCDMHDVDAAGFAGFIEQLERAIEAKTTLTVDMLDRDAWDLLVQVYTESHCIGHQCWHIHDSGHPNHDPLLRDRLGNPLETIYRSLDDGLARMIERAGDATVLLLAAHGMDTFRGADFLLPEILVRLGASNRPGQDGKASLASRARLAVSRARKSLPDPLQDAIRRVREGAEPPARMPRLRFDMTTSKCFPVANARSISGVRLNLAGREPTGALQRGSEADAFCESLTRDLLEIVDERTGGPLVAAVHRTADLHSGDRLEALPDLLVEWNPATPTGTTAHGDSAGATIRASSDKIGTVEGQNAYIRTGDHSPEGWFTLAGPGIEPGEVPEPVSVMDFHPTLCRLLGLDAPSSDGSPISALLAEEHR